MFETENITSEWKNIVKKIDVFLKQSSTSEGVNINKALDSIKDRIENYSQQSSYTSHDKKILDKVEEAIPFIRRKVHDRFEHLIDIEWDNLKTETKGINLPQSDVKYQHVIEICDALINNIEEYKEYLSTYSSNYHRLLKIEEKLINLKKYTEKYVNDEYEYNERIGKEFQLHVINPIKKDNKEHPLDLEKSIEKTVYEITNEKGQNDESLKTGKSLLIIIIIILFAIYFALMWILITYIIFTFSFAIWNEKRIGNFSTRRFVRNIGLGPFFIVPFLRNMRKAK